MNYETPTTESLASEIEHQGH